MNLKDKQLISVIHKVSLKKKKKLGTRVVYKIRHNNKPLNKMSKSLSKKIKMKMRCFLSYNSNKDRESKLKTSHVGKSVGKRTLPCSLGRNVNGHLFRSQFGKVGQFKRVFPLIQKSYKQEFGLRWKAARYTDLGVCVCVCVPTHCCPVAETSEASECPPRGLQKDRHQCDAQP